MPEDNRSCGGEIEWTIYGLYIEEFSNLQDMCGADIPDMSELEGHDEEQDRKTKPKGKKPENPEKISVA